MTDAELYEALNDFQLKLKIMLIGIFTKRPAHRQSLEGEIMLDFYEALNRFDEAVIDLGIRVAQQEAQRGEEEKREGRESVADAD